VDRPFLELLEEVVRELDLVVLALEVMPDVHLFVNASPGVLLRGSSNSTSNPEEEVISECRG
jgi:hypothetical protein